MRLVFSSVLFLYCALLPSYVAFGFSSSSSSPRRSSSSGNRRPTRRIIIDGDDPSKVGGPAATRRNHKSLRTDSNRRNVRDEQRKENVLFHPRSLAADQRSNEDCAKPLNLWDLVSKQNEAPVLKRKDDALKNSNQVVLLNVLDEQERSTVLVDTYPEADDCKGPQVLHSHFEYISLDDLFPNLDFGQQFYMNGKFRNEMRSAMRKDIFSTTPAYATLSPKVAAMMLDDDSSLQGSWNCIPKTFSGDGIPLRMTRLTQVLRHYLGSEAPTGDEFMMKIGGLCGQDPLNHWMDIIGVKDRRISHSWHQDTGVSYGKTDATNMNTSRYTVMFGFPAEDEYTGCGVFSHVIKLEYEHLAPKSHNENEPILFEGEVDEVYIIRPEFHLGKEILRYRDVDVLHSAPDVCYRQSVMRFM